MATKPPPPTFQPQRPDLIVNGSRASANVFNTISDNQVWLYSQDVPFCNFYTQTWHEATTPNYTILLKGRVPPYCNYMEFWFWCVGEYNEATTVPPKITVESLDTGDIQYISLITGGSETSTKGTALRENEARWVSLKGIPDSTLLHADFSATALEIVTAPSEAWAEIEVTIKTSTSGVQIYTGACLAVAPRGSLDAD